ncbi:tape measure domain-containing protein [Rhizobium sp. BK316]|uniref:tape measure protein n=1 Tax=Rhizobium sp. BK316 TaxID=2587053 RepID=UPI001843E4DD|nr:tape measure protein [Rhizobium sp. BK316]MBB3410662.1 tape measure domain-containing protein [Rhizobium sp. BK316]
MADEINLRPLVVDISATTARLEKALKRVEAQNSATMSKVQRDAAAGMAKFEQTLARTAQFEAALSRMDRSFANFGKSLVPSLGAITAALSAREVLAYADAWTSAKNSLAVAGVTGEQQAKVLDELYKSAQANAAPIGALSDLYGKAAQASDNLGASQQDLLKFSDGVAVALRVAGTSASAASGGLLQLGQLLGKARVEAEEFNSINEGARPILIAVANGLDAAGGSVNKLKALVNDGKVSGQQFFQAFLKGLPAIQAMAANSTTTIEQGIIKVNNAFTKYIGETDSSLGASQRLVAGLNALANNFDQTAEMTLKLAGVVAGALVGRSIVGMIGKLGLATSEVYKFVGALRAASTAGQLASAIGGVGAVAGPLGLIIGGTVVGALALFSSSSAEATQGARTYAQALQEIEQRAKDAAPAIGGVSTAIDEKVKNALSAGVEVGTASIDAARQAAVDLFSEIIDNAPRRLITEEQLGSLQDLRDGLSTGKRAANEVEQELFALANSNPNFQRLAEQLSPLLQQLSSAIAATDLLQKKLGSDGLSAASVAAYKQYDDSRRQGEEMLRIGKAYADEADRQNGLSKEQLAVEKEIASIRQGLTSKGGFLPDDQIAALAAKNVAADQSRSQSGRGQSHGVKATAESRFDQDIQSVKDRTAALVEEQRTLSLSYQDQERRRMALELEQNALADLREEARRKGQTDLDNLKISDEQRQKIEQASAAYAAQADALRRVQEAQDRADRSAEDFYDAFKSEISGAITGAESFSDALANIAKRLGDLLISNAFDALFAPKTSNSAGGLFGSLFAGIGSLLGFETGGYTGDRGISDVAGVVHGKEFVVNAAATVKHRPLLEAINSGRGFERGGYASMTLPTLRPPTFGGFGDLVGTLQQSRVAVDVGVTVDDDGKLQAYVRKESSSAVKDAAPKIVGTAINGANQRVVPTVADYQSNMAGRDYRNS